MDDPEPTPTPTPSPKPENTPTPTPDASDEPAETPNEPDEEPEITPKPEMITPNTGDNLQLGRYFVFMLVSVAVLLVIKNRLAKRDKE